MALPFVSQNEVQPTHVIQEPWFRHPPSVRCKCGITMYARVRQDTTAYVTRFECGDWKCQKCIIFIDNDPEKAHNAVDTPPSRS